VRKKKCKKNSFFFIFPRISPLFAFFHRFSRPRDSSIRSSSTGQIFAFLNKVFTSFTGYVKILQAFSIRSATSARLCLWGKPQDPKKRDKQTNQNKQY